MSISVLNIKAFNQSVSENDFYANYFSQHLKRNRSKISIPHKHDFFLFVVFTEGTGSHEIDFKTYPIKKGSVFMLKPGQMHSWILSEDIEGYIFFHSQSFYASTNHSIIVNQFPFFSSSYNPPLLNLSAKDLDTVKDLFKAVVEEAFSKGLMRYQKISSLINIIYIELSRIYLRNYQTDSLPNANYSIRFYELEQLIETKFQTEKSPVVYADLMNMSTKHLNRICKAVSGKTTLELIIDRVILEAKRMLLHSKSNFTEIGLILGYEDYAYFSRVFKNKTGQSPRDFQSERTSV